MQIGFYQLYIIHGYFKFHLLPCVYALLSGSEENHFKWLILQLREASLNVSLELKPIYLMIDFERSCMNAFKYQYLDEAYNLNHSIYLYISSFKEFIKFSGTRTQFVISRNPIN
jgi:hypothetical protein